MPTHYQILLHSVRVIENGTLEHEHGVNGLMVTLWYPVPGKTSLVTTRRIELADNVPCDYTQEDFPKQILFKEAILDSAYLLVELTSIKEPAKLAPIFYKVFSSVLHQVTDLVPGGDIMTAVARNAASTLLDVIVPGEKVELIGRGGWLITEATGSIELPVQLKVPKAVNLSKYSVDAAGNTVYSTKSIPKDFVNGEVRLTIKKI